MRQLLNDRIEGLLFIGQYDSEDKAIAQIDTESKAKEKFLKELYSDDDDNVRIKRNPIENGDCIAQVIFGEDDVYEYFYIDSETNRTDYVDLIDY